MLTTAILGSLQVPASATPSVPALTNALLGQTLEATLEALGPEGVLLRLPDGKQVLAQGSLSFPAGTVLALRGVHLPQGAGLRLQILRATPPPSPALLAPLVLGEAGPLLARLQSTTAQTPLGHLLGNLLRAGAAIAEQPETWSAWLKESLPHLSDPVTSPMEATFHRLQAKEGTGWFELPLPWAPGADTMRLWIEGDQTGPEPGQDPVHRVLLSVPFSGLGEVRLGLEQRSSGLRVRLWLEDPALVEELRPELTTELASLGRPVEFQVLPLPPGTPDLRSLTGTHPLQAMG